MLARLTDLAQTADQLGFSSAASQALEALAGALRQLMIAATGLCGNDAPAGSAELERALLWAAFVVGVDAGLTNDLQSAIAACQGGGGTGGAMTIQNQTGEIRCRFMGEGEGPSPTLPIPPLVAVAPNVLEWSVEFGEPCGSGQLEADFTFSTGGLLTFTTNTAWFPPPFRYENATYTVNGGFLAVDALGYRLICQRSSLWNGCAHPTPAENVIRVAAGTQRFFFEAGYINLLQTVGEQRASGRLLTIRFSPEP